MHVRIIAVDWSGAKKNSAKKIFWAEFRNGQPFCLKKGLDRDRVISSLESAATDKDEVVAGLDFAFSYPAWFLKDHGHSKVGTFWDEICEQGERWLEQCRPPFWGRNRRKCELPPEKLFRQTEQLALKITGIRPKSVFQLAGGGHVGTGSLRGMKYLPTLRKAGYSIWPFDSQSDSTLLEIYPRLLTGAVQKNNMQRRAEYLSRPEFQELPTEWLETAACSEDAFDAVVSAFRMNQHIPELRSLKRSTHERILIEGMIWNPGAEN